MNLYYSSCGTLDRRRVQRSVTWRTAVRTATSASVSPRPAPLDFSPALCTHPDPPWCHRRAWSSRQAGRTQGRRVVGGQRSVRVRVTLTGPHRRETVALKLSTTYMVRTELHLRLCNFPAWRRRGCRDAFLRRECFHNLVYAFLRSRRAENAFAASPSRIRDHDASTSNGCAGPEGCRPIFATLCDGEKSCYCGDHQSSQRKPASGFHAHCERSRQGDGTARVCRARARSASPPTRAHARHSFPITLFFPALCLV